MGLLDFHGTYKNTICCSLKPSSFWPSADVKLMSINLVHAIFWQCMFGLCMHTTISMTKAKTCFSTLSWPVLLHGETVERVQALPLFKVENSAQAVSYSKA
jgi:hypothetical protein